MKQFLFCVVVLLIASSASGQHLHEGASGLPHGIPDLCASPTITASQSGAWGSVSTWAPARLPGLNDRVSIPAGRTVSYATVSDASLDCIGVAGALVFSAGPTRLKVGTLMVYDAGLLEVGQPAAPAIAELIIANRAVNTSIDPEQFGTGLVAFGTVRMHGENKGATFVRLTGELIAGQTILQAPIPSQWHVGDTVLVPDTRHLQYPEWVNYVPQSETRTITAVSAGSVTVAPGLTYAHPGARNADDVLEILPHLGNLSRSIVIRSESPTGTRGHVLFAARADVDVRYVAFRNLGRTTLAPLDLTTFDAGGGVSHIGTNQIGRYALHMHHLFGPTTTPANGYQFTLIGNAIEDAPRWGITLHQSHYGLVQGNVIYKAAGVGVMTEDGNETGNVVDSNFAVETLGIAGGGLSRFMSTPTEWGIEGAGFWYRGTNNVMRGNVASASTDYGHMIMPYQLGPVWIPNFKGADTSDPMQSTSVHGNSIPILEFTGNETAGATSTGLSQWWIGMFGDVPLATGPSLIKDFTAWHFNIYGYYGYPSQGTIFDHVVMRGLETRLGNPTDFITGFWFGDYISKDTVIKNADVQGLRIGLTAPYMADTWSQSGANAGLFVIENSSFRNVTNISVATMYSVHGGEGLSPRKSVIRDTLFGRLTGGNWGAQSDIALDYTVQSARNLVQRDEVIVENFNRVAGDNFRVYYPEQRDTFIVPQTGSEPNPNPTRPVIGSPVAGETNAQNWAARSLAIAGAVAPCTDTRAFIEGFVCGGAPPDPPDPPGGGSGLTAIPTSVQAGNQMTVAWTAVPMPTVSDWLGLYAMGAPSQPEGPTWFYASSCTKAKGPTALASGSCLVTIPTTQAAGVHEFRLLANDSYTVVMTSPTFTVTVPPGPPPPPLPPPPSVQMVPTKNGRCQYTLVGVPVDATSGWQAQFRRNAVGFGTLDTSAPFTRQTTIVPGAYSWDIVWTKTSGANLTSAATTTTGCG